MNVIIEEIVSEFPVVITEEVVQIKISDATSYFDLIEVADTNFEGKNGFVPTVNEATGKIELQEPTSGPGGGIPDAPNNSNAYVRNGLAWVVGYTKTAIDNLLGAKVNNTRTINSKALSSDITLNADDIAETSTRFWLTNVLKSNYDNAVSWISTNGSNLLNHLTNTSNPHNTTASQVGAYTTSEVNNLIDNIPNERVYSLSEIGATNFDSYIKTLLAEKIGTQSLTIGEKEIPLFEVNAELPIVGNIIDNSFSGSSLDADFTTNLTLGSEYTMSSGLNVLSGNSAFGKYIQLEKTIAVTRWKQSLTFVVNSITSSSYGIALGLFSSNSTAMSVAKSSIIAQAFLHSDGSLKGKIRLYRAEDASTSFATSSVALSFSATDRLKLELTRIDNKFIVDFYNLTTSTSIQLEYNFNASITTVPLIPNTGKFKIYAFSGSYKIENYKYDNNGFLGGVAYLGDSISNSYVADVFTDGYQYKTTDNRKWNTFGGQADKSGDVLLALPQLTTENIPSRAVLFLGMNDYLQSVSTTNYKSNLNTIISALQAVGTEVFLITPSATNLGDISAYVTASLEVATDNSLLSVNAFTLLKASSGTGLNSIYNGDGVHPNSVGHQLIADTIKSTFLTLEPSTNTGRQVYILKNRGKGNLNDIVASDLYLLVDESNTNIPTTATDLDALKRDGSNANSDVDLGNNNVLSKTFFVGETNKMNILADLLTDNRYARFQDKDYEGIADITDITTTTSQLTNDGADGVNPFITALDIPTTGQASTLVREVKNMTGATLTKGTIVYISGANGNKPLVSKAIATTDALSARTFGLLQSNISNNGLGYCVIIGDLSGLDTSAFADGDQLYLSGVTAGAFTSTKTLAPTHLVYIGKVTRSHPTQGQIEVQIQNGYELNEIHDVAITSVTDKQLLSYDSTTSLWKNKSVTTADIADSTNKRYVTDANLTTIGNQSGTNSGDETTSTIKSKLGISTLSGSNTGDETTATITSKIGFLPYKFVQTSQTAHTGTTAETIIATATINGGTFNSSDVIKALYGLNKGTTTSGVILRLKINTSNTLTGAVQIAQFNTTGTGTVNIMKRNFMLNGGNLYGLNFANTTVISDEVNNATTYSSTAYNTANTLYLFFTIQLITSTDSVTPNLFNLTN